MYIYAPSSNASNRTVEPASLPPALALLLANHIAILLGPEPCPRPLILEHDILNTATIMLRFPHICQPGPSCSLLFPLHNLYALNVRTVDLIPHLHTHPRQLVAQQDAGIDTAPSDVDADS